MLDVIFNEDKTRATIIEIKPDITFDQGFLIAFFVGGGGCFIPYNINFDVIWPRRGGHYFSVIFFPVFRYFWEWAQ